MNLNGKIQLKTILMMAVLLIESLFILSCKNKKNAIINDKLVLFSEFPIKDSIKFDNVVEFMEGKADELFLQDTVLIIFNDGNGIDYYFYNYYLNRGFFSKGYLKHGRGPNECLGPFSAGFCSDFFWVYDITLKKILIMDKIEAINSITPKKLNEFTFEANAYDIDFIDNQQFYATGITNTKNKIEEINLISGNIKNAYGSFSFLPEDLPIDGIKDSFLSYIHIRPSGGKLVLPYRYTDVIEIFDINNDFSNIAIQGPEQFEVEFEIGTRAGQHYMVKTKETRKAFVNGTVTDDYIYLLFSGHSRQDKNWSYGKYIFIYDWKGNPVRKLVLDRYVHAFTISEKDNVIYSYDMKTGYIITAKI
jgi:hypothetical protein